MTDLWMPFLITAIGIICWAFAGWTITKFIFYYKMWKIRKRINKIRDETK